MSKKPQKLKLIPAEEVHKAAVPAVRRAPKPLERPGIHNEERREVRAKYEVRYDDFVDSYDSSWTWIDSIMENKGLVGLSIFNGIVYIVFEILVHFLTPPNPVVVSLRVVLLFFLFGTGLLFFLRSTRGRDVLPDDRAPSRTGFDRFMYSHKFRESV